MADKICCCCSHISRISLLRGRCFYCFELALLTIDSGLSSWSDIEREGFATDNSPTGKEKQLIGYSSMMGVGYCCLCDWKVTGSVSDTIEKNAILVDNLIVDHLSSFHDRFEITKKEYEVNKKLRYPRVVYRG